MAEVLIAMVALRRFRNPGPSFADLVPYAGLVADGTILLKDGSLMAGWYFAGPDSESSTNQERNEVSRQINTVLAKLGSGWMIQVEAVRVPTTAYPAATASFFPDAVTRAIDEERRRHFEAERGHYESQHALILTYRPPERRRSVMTRYVYSDDESRSETYADLMLDSFRSSVREVEQYLANVLSIRRMVTRTVREQESGRDAHYDELFQFIRFCISGENHPVRLPEIPMYLDWLATAELHHGLSPVVDGRYLAIVAVDGFPAESWPGILNSLDLMPLTYRWSSRFIFLDDQEARQKLERTRKKWQQKVRPFFDQLFQTQSRSIDQDAMLMVAETEDAIAEASSQLVAYGYYTPVIAMFDTDDKRLREQAEAVRRLVQAEGFGARIETLNATEAYLGSLPGNSYANVREPLINTRNLADLIPVNSVWSGSATAPCPFYPPNAPPLMQVASGSTPFRLNLHVDDVGHTLIFGPTGSGKSTLLALIAAQFRRYASAQVFAFDKGRSLLPLTLAAGGDHYEVGAGDGTSRLAFCPLAELATDNDRAWAVEWIETLVAMQGVKVTPDHRNAIARQVGLMAAARGRSLSDFVSGVQMREIKDALLHYTVDGPMGQLLDAEQDGLTLGAFQTFEVEELMNLGERNLVPVLLYLFRRIEKRLTGAPSLILLDEAWLMLGHPTFRDKIREWLKVLRKANCAVVLATQSISDAERSGIIDVLKESCPTKICLPNGAAREPGTREFYERIGFNERQVEIVATATPKREYYIASPEGRRLFDMSLGRVTLALSGGQRQRVAIGRAIVREPQLFLFDEPLSNLDAALRVQTRIEIGKLHRLVDATMIYVTHDQVEAMTLADRIVVMNGGRVEQVGTPLELYRRPQNLFVAGFIGSPMMNFLPVSVSRDQHGANVRGPNGIEISFPADVTGSATLGVRPENLSVTDGEGFVTATLQLEEHLGEHRLIHAVASDGTGLVAKLPDGAAYPADATLHFTFDPRHAHLFGTDGLRVGTPQQGTLEHA